MNRTNIEVMEKLPVPRAILTLSIPALLTTIISLVYNLTDTFFIGLLKDSVQLGAISLAFPVFMILQSVGNIFAQGAPSYISRSLGGKQYEEVKRTSSVSAYIAVFITLIMTAVYFIFQTPILSILGTSENNITPTREYLNIIIGCGFVMTLQVALPAFLRAEGKVKEASIGSALGIVVNMILDPIFILVFHQGVAGAAWATILGNVGAVIYFLFIYLKTETSLSLRPHDFRPSKRILTEVLKIGVPSAASSILMSVASILLQNVASDYGDYVISAYGVASKMIMMVFMLVLGYVSGYSPFAGYNYGAKNYKRMLSAFRFVLISSTCICIVFLIPFIFLPHAFMTIFTPDQKIIDTGVQFLRAYAWCIPFLGIQVSLMCTFQATGSGVKSFIVNLGRKCLFHMPFIVLFNKWWQLDGLVFSNPVADVCTVLLAVLLGIPVLRKLSNASKIETASEVPPLTAEAGHGRAHVERWDTIVN